MIPWIVVGGACFILGFWVNEAILRHDMRVIIMREIEDREAYYLKRFSLAPDYYHTEYRV